MAVRPAVLVVEDDTIGREGVATILGRSGYDVVAAGDGRQALDLLAAGRRPDVILLDMLMPVLDGWHFLNHLKAGPHAGVPVVVVTGANLTREWAADHGCAGLIRKPVDTAAMVAEVRRVLGAAA
jgi:CheY-like chemotaxis protein